MYYTPGALQIRQLVSVIKIINCRNYLKVELISLHFCLVCNLVMDQCNSRIRGGCIILIGSEFELHSSSLSIILNPVKIYTVP